jgi:hypothetical protein
MAIRYIKGITLACDFCGELFNYDADDLYEEGKENKMKKDAEQDGWTFFPGGICKCESCNYEEQQEKVEKENMK